MFHTGIINLIIASGLWSFANFPTAIQNLPPIKEFIFVKMDCYLSQLLKMVNELGALQNIQSDIASLNETVTTLNTTAEALSSTVDSLTTTLSSISDTVGTINTNVSTVKDDVSTVKDDVSTVKTDVSNTKSAVAGLDSAIQTVKTIIDTIDTNTSATNTTVTAMNGYVQRTNSTVNTISNKENYEDIYGIGSIVLNFDSGSTIYQINIYEYIQAGYRIGTMYVTNVSDTSQVLQYTDGSEVSIDNGTYLTIRPNFETTYRGDYKYNFIVKLTNSSTSSLYQDMYVIGRFEGRTRCFLLPSSKYQRIDSNFDCNPYALPFALGENTSE